MEKDIFDKIAEQDFENLSLEEQKEFLSNFSSKEEFEGVQAFLNELKFMKKDADRPSDETKGRLDDLFDQVNVQRRPAWYLSLATMIVLKDKPVYKQPLMYAAALILCLFLFVPLQQMNITHQNNKIAVVEKKSDPVLMDEEMRVEESIPQYNVESEVSQAESKGVLTESRNEAFESTLTLAQAEDMDKIESSGDQVSGFADFTTTSGQVSDLRDAVGAGHPDGIYKDWATASNYSVPASRQPEVLSLLTATF